MGDCSICVEPYNRSTRLPVPCGFCDFSACRACYEKFLTSQPQAKCMGCSKELTRQELAEKFTRAFLNGKYRTFRAKYLLELEKAMLPATQTILEQILDQERIREQIQRIHSLIVHYKMEIQKLERKYNSRIDASERKLFVRKCPNTDCRGFLSTQWKCNLCERKTCKECNECILEDEHKCDPSNVETAKLLAKDSKPCPSCGELIFKIEGCFGKDTPVMMWDGTTKMSQEIRVGDLLVGDEDFGKAQPRRVLELCSGEDELFRVEQEHGMDYIVNSKHTLVLLSHEVEDEVVEITVEDYLKLPEKRAEVLLGWKSDEGCYPVTRIKVSPIGRGRYYGWMVDNNHRFLLPDSTVVRNCDQIFCTQCHTAFSWRTGRRETGVIHNPHFFEWLRKNNRENHTITERLIPQCGREIDQYFVRRISDLHFFDHDERLYLTTRNVLHLRAVILPRFEVYGFADNQDLRINFLRQRITEEAFQSTLQKREKARQKKQEIHRLFSMVIQCATDILYRFFEEPSIQDYKRLRRASRLLQDQNDQVERHEVAKQMAIACSDQYCNEIIQLGLYANECLSKISKTYNCRLYSFTDRLELR